MKYTENALNVLASIMHKGIGKAWIIKNLSPDMSEESIVALLNKAARVEQEISLEDFKKKKNTIESLLSKREGFMDGVVAVGDDEFPPHRGRVKNSEKPVFLFYKGDIQLLQESNNNVAVIGLLEPDRNIEEVEKEVVKTLVSNDATIVSGLALGCDSIAHRQALISKGKTIAILPSPLNHILPSTNKDLALEIVRNGGLLITEYLTDAKSKQQLAGRYKERDRLQALFSDCIVLSASYAKNNSGKDSGSRLAMEYASVYEIPRAVIYNPSKNADDPQYDLNRQCMSEEKDITVIDRDNMGVAAETILSSKPASESKVEQSGS